MHALWVLDFFEKAAQDSKTWGYLCNMQQTTLLERPLTRPAQKNRRHGGFFVSENQGSGGANQADLKSNQPRVFIRRPRMLR